MCDRECCCAERGGEMGAWITSESYSTRSSAARACAFSSLSVRSLGQTLVFFVLPPLNSQSTLPGAKNVAVWSLFKYASVAVSFSFFDESGTRSGPWCQRPTTLISAGTRSNKPRGSDGSIRDALAGHLHLSYRRGTVGILVLRTLRAQINATSHAFQERGKNG